MMMPEKRTIAKARKDKRAGKAPSTQAGEFVHEEIRKIRRGEHGARRVTLIERGAWVVRRCPAAPRNPPDHGRVLQVQSFSINGGSYAFQVFGHCQRTRCDAGGPGCMGSKQYERKDARSHHAKDAPGEKHRTGSIRICARTPQAPVQLATVLLSLSLPIHATP